MKGSSLIPGRMYAARCDFILRATPAAFVENNHLAKIKEKDLVMFVGVHPQTQEWMLAKDKTLKYQFFKVVFGDQVGYISFITRHNENEKIIGPQIMLSEFNVDEID